MAEMLTSPRNVDHFTVFTIPQRRLQRTAIDLAVWQHGHTSAIGS